MRTGDLIISIILHVAVILTFVISGPLTQKKKLELGDVMHIRLSAGQELKPQAPPVELKPIEIPSPIQMDEPIVPVMEVASKTQKAIVNKPKPKPKPEKKEQYQPQTEKGDQNRTGQEGGKKDISDELSSGSRFGGASIDNASFSYPYWFDQAFSKIERNWTNPVFSNSKIQCTIYFQVIRSGRIIRSEIKESSGISAYDRACLQAVERSQPLPPLPDTFTEEIIGISLIFPYLPG